MRWYIFATGDESVGIPSISAVFDDDGLIFNDEEKEEHREIVKKFAEDYYAEPVGVMTEEEIEKENKLEQQEAHDE